MNDATHWTAQLLDEKDVAEVFRISRQTLRVWRMNGRGPIFIRVGRCIRYRREDLDVWLEKQAIANAPEPVR